MQDFRNKEKSQMEKESQSCPQHRGTPRQKPGTILMAEVFNNQRPMTGNLQSKKE